MKLDHYSKKRKINAQLISKTKPDGTENNNNRIEIGPTKLAFNEWEESNIKIPNLAEMREFRLKRLVNEINKRKLGGVLLFDPLNIRYATDTTNMQLWNTHNPFRACLILANGHIVLWDYDKSELLCKFNPLVKEVRSGASMFYFSKGDNVKKSADEFSKQLDDIIKSHVKNKNLAIDKIMPHGLRAIEHKGYITFDGEELMEHTRSIKGPEEIKAMKCAIHSCEMSVKKMEEKVIPGMSENEVWAILHYENIIRGGEWIETRLLTSGPRTNPWFQECGPRIIQNNEILAFDTDLIGAYGFCSDISRTWFVGNGSPLTEMKDDYKIAYDHIMENMNLLKPGISFKELSFSGHALPQKYQKQKYSCKMHGVGLCDEWPLISYPDKYEEFAFDYVLKPGMTLCVEALVSRENGDFSIKLEDQVLITENGFENLTKYHFDQKLMN